MFFFGWGKNNRQWIINEELILMATWSYIDIFFFPVAFNIKWHLLGNNRLEDKIITYEKVKELIPENTPKISIWHRYGLIIGIAIIIFIIVLSSFSSTIK